MKEDTKMRNKLHTLIALVLTVCLLAAVVPAFADGAPTLTGVQDQSVMAGTEFDALAGVTAADAAGADLTAMIVIESTPALEFKNGKATPENPGDYELVYSVADANGETAEDYATLTVTKKTGEEQVYRTFDFSTAAGPESHGWEAKIGDSAEATAELKEGAYVIEIKNPGDGDGAVQLAKAGYPLKAADYKIKIWAKSTKKTYAHILARNEQAEGWETFGGAFNVEIGPEIAPLELNFTSPGEGSAELLFNLGKITPNPDNAEDTTPEDFKVTIDKIELYEISGEETQVPTYTADFAAGEGVTAETSEGAAASVAFADGKANVTIDSYPGEGGGVWSVKANILLGDTKIVKGQKYFYSFKVNAANGQGGEVLVESAEKAWENRANFNGLSAAAGEETVVSSVFTAEADVEDPVIRLQIGNAPEGAASNSIVISDVVFGNVEGDKETIKTIDAFKPFGRNTENAENPACPWDTFNGTDEDNDRGVGTIWAEDGTFFYRIDNGGTVDWHNKLMCGFGGNPLMLASDSYYTVEITARATQPVSCGVFLNPMGGWDPRFSEGMDLTTEFQTFRFSTKDTFVVNMDFELLFQFGSEALSNMGEVTVEFQNVTIYQTTVQ